VGLPYTRGLHEVADGVFAWLQPDGGWGWSNAGLVVGGGPALLVDTLFDLRLTAEMLSAMRAAAPTSSIGTVVNTHANGDHCYGNQLLDGARIIASAAAAEEMSHVPPSVLASLVQSAPAGSYVRQIFGAFDFEGITLRLPTSTFSGTLSVPVGTTLVELVELGPAHTAGDVVAVVPSRRVLFAGDLLFIGGHPIVWAGPVGNWVAALDRILAMDVDVIVPGHGPVTDKAGVREVRAYFVELEAMARPLYEEGLTPLEAARALRPRLGVGWGEAERLVVNVAACFRALGYSGAVDTFADMATLAGS
jgi:glyoxylase-like metal-dependent hydrolase (beta-lactamase superfamily II)